MPFVVICSSCWLLHLLDHSSKFSYYYILHYVIPFWWSSKWPFFLPSHSLSNSQLHLHKSFMGSLCRWSSTANFYHQGSFPSCNSLPKCWLSCAVAPFTRQGICLRLVKFFFCHTTVLNAEQFASSSFARSSSVQRCCTVHARWFIPGGLLSSIWRQEWHFNVKLKCNGY